MAMHARASTWRGVDRPLHLLCACVCAGALFASGVHAFEAGDAEAQGASLSKFLAMKDRRSWSGQDAPTVPGPLAKLLGSYSVDSFFSDIFGKKPFHFKAEQGFQEECASDEALQLEHLMQLMQKVPTGTLREIVEVSIDGKLGQGHLMNHSIRNDAGMRQLFDTGASTMIRLERLPKCMRPPDSPSLQLLDFQEQLAKTTGFGSTVHVLASTKGGAVTLPLHYDYYDVIIVQLNGSKTWTMCTPPLPASLAELNLDQNSFSQAERGAAYALHLEAVWESKNRQYDYDKQQRAKEKAAAEGESQYRTVGTPVGFGFDPERQRVLGRKSDLFDRGAMDCQTLTLNKGDRIYIPMGIFHGAVTDEGGSAHLDFGFGRVGITWAHVVANMIKTTLQTDMFTDILLYGANGPDVVVPESIALLEPVPVWYFLDDAKEEDSEKLLDSMVAVQTHYLTVVIPAFRAHVIHSRPELKDVVDQVIDVISTGEVIANTLFSTKPELDARYERANNDCSKYGAVEDLKAEVEAMLQRKKQAQKQKEPEVAAAKKDEL